MKPFCVTLEQMLLARETRAEIQTELLRCGNQSTCLVCLTLNIAGEVKRTALTRVLFDRGVQLFERLGYCVLKRRMTDAMTGSEAFWLLKEPASQVKDALTQIEDSFPAARLFDFDVLDCSGEKLSRTSARRCLICGEPAAACARSRRHGLDAVKSATNALLMGFCADVLADAGCASLLDELYTTPKPGLVDRANCGAHRDMDVPLFETSAAVLRPYFHDAAAMGMAGCTMDALRARGMEAENAMFAATSGVNTHKGMVYSMGLLLAGMGQALFSGADAVGIAASLARQDAALKLRRALDAPCTNGNGVYRAYGAKGAIGEAADGFPTARFCAGRIAYYRAQACPVPGALALCDVMARLEDTNLLHRGGREGLSFVQTQAASIARMPAEDRLDALTVLDGELIRRNLSPGGSADMLALGYLLERWVDLSRNLFLPEDNVCVRKEGSE